MPEQLLQTSKSSDNLLQVLFIEIIKLSLCHLTLSHANGLGCPTCDSNTRSRW